VVRDRNGKVVTGATITIYLADTTIPATVYPSKTSVSALTAGHTTSDANGRWIVYADDSDYPVFTLFDSVVTKVGYPTRTYPDITIGGSAH